MEQNEILQSKVIVSRMEGYISFRPEIGGAFLSRTSILWRHFFIPSFQGFYVPLTKFAPLQAFAKIIRDVGVEVKTLNLQGNGLFHLNDVTKTLGGLWLPSVG